MLHQLLGHGMKLPAHSFFADVTRAGLEQEH